jgi:hypothetical protein
MAVTRLWTSIDKITRKMADEANDRADKAGIPDNEEKRQYFFQYIDKEIAKLKEDTIDPVGQSRFKTLLKDRAVQLYTTTGKQNTSHEISPKKAPSKKRKKADDEPNCLGT